MNFKNMFVAISKDKGITAQATRVLHFMMGYIDVHSFTQIPQAEISKNLKMTKQNVSRAIKLLSDKEILMVGRKSGKSLSYQLNPNFYKKKEQELNRQNLDKLIGESLLMGQEEAREAGTIGYMARAFIQATLPHSKTTETEFVRTNGEYKLKMTSDSETGMPYGSIPRLLLSWMTTEAVRTKNPVLELGHTLSGFMAEIGMIPTGGRWGSIFRLKDQMQRLFSSSVSCTYNGNAQRAGININMVRGYKLWWDPKDPDQAVLWKSLVTLATDFYNEIIENPVPIDLRALRVLKKSPLAIDIYSWLTYRNSYLRKPCAIRWGTLQHQFGAGYPENEQGKKDFKKKFIKAMKKVAVVYDVNISSVTGGIELRPSNSHVCKISTGKPT
jgi:DNA-binding transcriptional ArsR family regulator